MLSRAEDQPNGNASSRPTGDEGGLKRDILSVAAQHKALRDSTMGQGTQEVMTEWLSP